MDQWNALLLTCMGHSPGTDSNNAFILVICDCFTKWTEAIALPNQEAITVTKEFVDHFVSRFGVPINNSLRSWK